MVENQSTSLERLISELLGTSVSALSLPQDLPLAQIPGWDSIKLVRFLLAVEKKYSIQFRASEITQVKTWAELMKLIEKKSSSHGT